MSYKPVMPYVKVHVHKLEDVRFLRLSPALIGRWTQLMILARRCDAGGALVQNGKPMKVEDIALLFRCEPETLIADIKSLRQAFLIHANGRGWQLNDFEDEQGPDDEVKRAYWRERQRTNREKKKVVIDNIGQVKDSIGNVLDSQAIESESELKSESESELKKESVVSREATRREFTDRLIPLSKTEIISLLQIPTKYVPNLEGNERICKADLLAEFARNMTRKNVSKPGSITAMNLIKDELPDEKWYHPKEWNGLPSFIKKKIDLESLEGKSYQFGLSIEEEKNEDNH